MTESLCFIFNMEMKEFKQIETIQTNWNNSIQTIMNFQLVEYGRVQKEYSRLYIVTLLI